MQRNDWSEKLRAIAEERIALSERKNQNYASDEDGFFNFTITELLSHRKLTREQGIFVRMCDKIARLGCLLFNNPDAVGESLEDTVKDLANYADILLLSLRERNFPPEKNEAIPENPHNPLHDFFYKIRKTA